MQLIVILYCSYRWKLDFDLVPDQGQLVEFEVNGFKGQVRSVAVNRLLKSH